MTQLTIHTEYLWFAQQINESLSTDCKNLEVEIIIEKTWNYELKYSSRSPRSKVQDVINALSPLQPRKRSSMSVEEDNFHLYLGTPRQLNEFPVRMKSDGNTLLDQLCGALDRYFTCDQALGTPLHSTLKYGGAPLFVRHMISWVVYRQSGVHLVEKQVWGDEDDDIHLNIQDPRLRGEDFRYALPLTLYVDEHLAQAQEVINVLADAGYQPKVIHLAYDDWSDIVLSYGFLIDRGPFKLDLDEARYLEKTISEGLRTYGVDLESHPVNFHSIRDDLSLQSDQEINIYLPLNHWQKRVLNPISGEDPRRWQVHLFLDNLLDGLPILQSLQSFGFTRVKGQSYDHTDPQLLGGVQVDWGSAIDFPMIQSMVIQSLNTLGALPTVLDNSEPQYEHLSFLHSQTLDHTNVVRDNIINLVVYTKDFNPDQWQSKLKRLCQNQTLTIVTETGIEANRSVVYKRLSLMPWLDVTYTPILAHAQERYLSLSEFIDQPKEELHLSVTDSDDSWDHEESDWDNSELQEWLMSSLHDATDDNSPPQVSITCGTASPLLTQWLKTELYSIFKAEVMITVSTAGDDMDFIVCIPSVYQSHDLLDTAFDNNIAQLSDHDPKNLTDKLPLHHTQSLIDPPLHLRFKDKANNAIIESQECSDLYEFQNNPKGDRILYYRDMKLITNAKSPHQRADFKTYQNVQETESTKTLLFHPAFVKLCDHLIAAVYHRQTQLISASPGIGLKSAIRWLSSVTQTPIITPESTHTSLSWLEELSQVKLPLILIEGFDRLSSEVKTLIKRATLTLQTGEESRGSMMIGSLSNNYIKETKYPISDYLNEHINRSHLYDGFRLSIIPRWSASQIFALLKVIMNRSHKGDSEYLDVNSNDPPLFLHSYIDLLMRGELHLLRCELKHSDMDDSVEYPMGYRAICHLAYLNESFSLDHLKDQRSKLDLLFSKSLPKAVLNRLQVQLNDAMY